MNKNKFILSIGAIIALSQINVINGIKTMTDPLKVDRNFQAYVVSAYGDKECVNAENGLAYSDYNDPIGLAKCEYDFDGYTSKKCNERQDGYVQYWYFDHNCQEKAWKSYTYNSDRLSSIYCNVQVDSSMKLCQDQILHLQSQHCILSM